ncbi:hypothetical protein [Methylopila sp. 73B]|uniref:hypothetical protein n=1 Tax=Methylopila sp. 73B TaxID=1120792 RepID=UPI0012DF0948|nr:hypothetical protein [Methylopila sp. 73B]
MAQLIASAGPISAFLNEGGGDYLLITFNDAADALKTDGRSFWGQALVEKNGVATIGVVTTEKNWYAPSAMEEVAARLKPILARYPKVLCYGNSMGGYAAIRFSKLLGATHVLAIVPQAGIDPSVVTPFDRRYTTHFGKGGGGMIEPGHVAGKVWIVYDPLYSHDSGHAKLLKKAAPDARMIRVPLRGHGVIHLTRGSRSTLKLFDAVFADRYLDVVRMYRRRKRASWVYYYTMATAMVRRRPAEILRLLEVDKRFDVPIANRTQLIVAANARIGRRDEALSVAIAYSRMHPTDLKTPLKILDSMLAHKAPQQASAFIDVLDESGYQHPAFGRTRRLVEQGLKRAAVAVRIAPFALAVERLSALFDVLNSELAASLL